MKRKIATVIAIGFVTVMASCSKKNDNNPSPSKAHAMFVNACINTTTLGAAVNGTDVTNATNLAFLKNSGYQDVTAGDVTIKFLFPTTATPLVNTSYNLTANNNYTIFAAGQVNTPSIVVAGDDMTGPSSGHAKVRFVNLSADSSTKSLYVGSVVVDSGVTSSTVSGFKEIAAGNANVNVQSVNNPADIVSLTGQSFGDGKIYTIVYTGIASGNGSAQPTITIMNNN